ncbi:MAG: TetR/AcrR family transcriptional regulator [Sphingomonas sp.]
MTKPREDGDQRSERKRAAILDAAAGLFLEHGYAATSMDEVARRASVSKQTIYAQFTRKEALFDAMVRRLTHGAGDRVQVGLDAPPEGVSLTAHLVGYAVRQLAIARTPMLMQLRRLVIAEAARFPELGRALYEGGPGRAIAGLAQAFARWDAQGLLDTPDPQAAASYFNWLIMGEPVNRAMLLGDAAVPGPAALERHANEAVRIFMAAFAR